MINFNLNNSDAVDFLSRSSTVDAALFSLDREKIEFFKNVVQKYNIDTVLDIACGKGDVVLLLSKWGKKVTALEKEPLLLQELYARSRLENLNLDILLGDMRDISILYKNRCDLVLSLNNSLSKLSTEKDIWGTLAQVFLKLQPGGLVVIHTLDYERLFKEAVEPVQLLNTSFRGLKAKVFFTLGREGEAPSLVYKIFPDRLSSSKEEEIVKPVWPVMRKDLNMWLAELGFEKIQNINWHGSEREENNNWDLITLAFRPSKVC